MPEIASILRNAVSLHRKGNLKGAENLYRAVLKTAPENFDALHLCRIACGQQGRFRESSALITRALEIKPDSADARNSMTKALNELGEFDEAVRHGERALKLRPDYIDAYNNVGNALAGLGRYSDAIETYRRALSIQPDSVETWSNLGAALRFLGKFGDAIACMQRALEINPRSAETLNNLGAIFSFLERFDEAVSSIRRAIEIKPDYAEAYQNLGSVLHRLKQYPEAAESFRKAVDLQPDNLGALSMFAHLRRKMCDWRDIEKLEERLIASIPDGRSAVLPFPLLSVTDDPGTQLACARRYAEERISVAEKVSHDACPRLPNGRIRVAYLSADFHQHATAFLMAEIFERHDRDKFEISAVSYGPDDESPMRRRLTSAFDNFIDAREKSDREIAGLIAELGTHIAVDLKGYTQDGRPAVLAYRPAPIQVNFLGYPGTMGVEFIDYILTDSFISPPEQQPYFSEKFVHLPNTYQPNDSKRPIAKDAQSRSDHGLPEEGLVFCCFNQGYKITAPVFDVWMRLLQRTPGSVFWLFADNSEMKGNLRREAEARGVAADRLVFASRAPLPEHLARHRLADLFLDTFPYNAHTTASDALWAGLPVLTCAGKSFAARVAGSLLNAAGLPELVTNSLPEYESLALRLAENPVELRNLRERLVDTATATPLFDSERFTRDLETAYIRMLEMWRAGEPSQPFSV